MPGVPIPGNRPLRERGIEQGSRRRAFGVLADIRMPDAQLRRIARNLSMQRQSS